MTNYSLWHFRPFVDAVFRMRESRSAVLKMLKGAEEEAREDRRVAVFPPAYREDATPHERRFDFSPTAKEACRSGSVAAGLRVAKVIFVGDVAVGKTCLINRCAFRCKVENLINSIQTAADPQLSDLIKSGNSLSRCV